MIRLSLSVSYSEGGEVRISLQGSLEWPIVLKPSFYASYASRDKSRAWLKGHIFIAFSWLIFMVAFYTYRIDMSPKEVPDAK